MKNIKIKLTKIERYIAIFIFLLMGCANDDSEFTFKSEYKSTRIEFSKIRIFTQDGEVVDRNAYQKVIQRHTKITRNSTSDNLSFLKKNKLIKNSEIEYLKFKDKNATLGDAKNEKKYTYKVSGNFVRFIGNDTLMHSSIYGKDEVIFNKISLHKPINNKVPILLRFPVNIGKSKVYGYIHEQYAKLHSNTVRYPLLTVHYYNYSGVSFLSTRYRINNELNENIYKHLSIGDTLLVQQNWMVFE